MSSKSSVGAKSVVSRLKRASTSEAGASKKGKTLREKVLGKTAQALSVLRPLSSSPKKSRSLELVVPSITVEDAPAAPETLVEERLKETSLRSSHGGSGALTGQEQRVSVGEVESIDDFDTSSIGSASSAGQRVSFYVTTCKGLSGDMEQATRAANDLFLKGKEALEMAGNMKRECKAIAHESLQGLNEIVLSVAGSRARHLNSLERERARHAQEVVRIERAHAKELSEVRQNLIAEMGHARDEITGTLKEVKAIRSWLGYEMDGPFGEIKAAKEGVEKLEKTLREELKCILRETSTTTGRDPKWVNTEEKLTGLSTKATSISNQIDTLRRTVDEIKLTVAASASAETIATAHPILPDNSRTDDVTPDWTILTKILEQTTRICKTMDMTAPPEPPSAEAELAPLLEPLYAKLGTVSSDLRELRETAARPASPPRPAIGAELAMAEVRQTLETIATGVTGLTASERPQQSAAATSYAQMAARPKPPKLPNHTLIISSTDPRSTSDRVMEQVRVALDFKNTGARVDRCRKAKNQKVVLSCATKEDLAVVKGKVGSAKELQVSEPKSGNPMACVRDVLACHTDDEIVEMLKKQNKHLLQDVDMAEQTIKVRYRKRARNALECHPVLELSTETWKRLTEAGKVHVGIRRSRIEDQSPLVQCTKCLGYGHKRSVCREKAEACCYCGGAHTGRDCPVRAKSGPPTCVNCVRARKQSSELAHVAFSVECQERQRWDFIARSRISYC